MIEKGRCDDGFIWNLSASECEFDKSCDVGEYLDYVNSKYRKELVDKLVEKCGKDIDGNVMAFNATLYYYGLNRKVSRSCRRYVITVCVFTDI